MSSCSSRGVYNTSSAECECDLGWSGWGDFTNGNECHVHVMTVRVLWSVALASNILWLPFMAFKLWRKGRSLTRDELLNDPVVQFQTINVFQILNTVALCLVKVSASARFQTVSPCSLPHSLRCSSSRMRGSEWIRRRHFYLLHIRASMNWH